MSKISFLVLIFLFTIVYQKTLKTNTKCMNLGDDCDLTSYCCDKWVCRDYRCALKGTKENQVKWAPKGPKCDYFHHCGDYYKCESHRCEIDTKQLTKSVEKSLKNEVVVNA